MWSQKPQFLIILVNKHALFCRAGQWLQNNEYNEPLLGVFLGEKHKFRETNWPKVILSYLGPQRDSANHFIEKYKFYKR